MAAAVPAPSPSPPHANRAIANPTVPRFIDLGLFSSAAGSVVGIRPDYEVRFGWMAALQTRGPPLGAATTTVTGMPRRMFGDPDGANRPTTDRWGGLSAVNVCGCAPVAQHSQVPHDVCVNKT